MFKLKKVSPRRGLACLLVMFALLTVFAAFAESAQEPAEAPAVEAVEVAEVAEPEESALPWVTETIQEKAEEAGETKSSDPDISFIMGLKNIAMSTGIARSFTDPDIDIRNYIMMAVACFLLYLAIVKQFEPLLLLPIAFGMLLANLPAAGLMGHPHYTYYNTMQEALAAAKQISKDAGDIVLRARTVTDPATGIVTNTMMPALETSNGGLLYYLYKGVKLGIY
ncbi:MAG: sodium ion-translocating decarboxylase subunit beta, partial [bacterium]